MDENLLLQQILEAKAMGTGRDSLVPQPTVKYQKSKTIDLPQPIQQAFAPPQKTFPKSFDELNQALYLAQTEGLENQRAGIGQLESQINELRNLPQQNQLVHLLMAASDIVGDTNFLKNYQTPEQIEEQRRLRELGLSMQLQKAKGDVTSREADLLRTMYRDKMDQERLRLQEKALGLRGGGIDLTPGELARDKAFGSKFEDEVKSLTSFDENLASLGEAVQMLETRNDISGPGISALPDMIRKRMYPESFNVQQSIERVIQQSLRETLGAQFTQKEGEQLLSRTYDPALPQATNKERAERLMREAQAVANAKRQALIYFNENGSLKGYQGPRDLVVGGKNYSIEKAINPMAALGGGANTNAPAGSSIDAKRKRLEELRRKRGQ